MRNNKIQAYQKRFQIIGITVLTMGLTIAPLSSNMIQTAPLQTVTAATTSALSKLMLKIDGKVSGKYTYYYTGKNLCRTKDGKNSTILTNKISGDFYIEGSYLYYVDSSTNALYRMKKDGTSKARLAKYVTQILTMRNGIIYYRNTSGYTCSSKKNGEGKAKLLSNSQSYHKVIMNDCIYYMTYYSGTDGYTLGYKLTRMNLDGSNKKTILKKKLSKDITNVFSIEANNNAVYFCTGDSLYRIDADQTVTKIFTSDQGHSASISYIGDDAIYLMDQTADSSKALLNKLALDGTITATIELGKDNTYFDGTITLAKFDDYFICFCYGEESSSYFYLLDSAGNCLQEIPSTDSSLAYSRLSTAIIKDGKILVKYSKGSKSVYKSIKIK